MSESETCEIGPAPKKRRARGKGHLWKRGDVWWSVVCHRGQHIRESTGHADRRKAQEYLDAKLAQLGVARATGPRVVTSELRRVTVKQRLDALLLDFGLRGVRGLAAARSHLGYPPEGSPDRASAKVLRHFGPLRAVDLTGEAVDRYVEARLREGARPATVNRETQLLAQAVRPFLARLGLPALAVRRQREDNARQGFFEKAEVEAVIAALPEHLGEMVRFAHLSGWRRGEVVSLRWSDVDRDGRAVRLRPERSKNGRGRTLALAGELSALVERRWQARLFKGKDGEPRVAELVFHRDGRPVVDFRKAWASACAAAGCRGRLFHDLRRTAVRNMVRAGVPERVAMAVSGHRTRSMFDRYNIVSETDLRAAAERTSEYLSAIPHDPTYPAPR
jgi:integrase